MEKVPQQVGVPVRKRRKVWEDFLQCPFCEKQLVRNIDESRPGLWFSFRCECSIWKKRFSLFSNVVEWERTQNAG